MLPGRSLEISDAEMDAIRREALDFVGIGLYRYLFDGTVIFMNRGAVRILGLDEYVDKPEALVGKNIAELIRYVGPAGALRAQIRKAGHARNVEYAFQTLAGDERWALHDSYLVTDTASGEEAIQVIIREITQRKRAELAIANEHERLVVTLRAIGDGVITTDVDSKVTLMNRVAEELTGWKQEEARGKLLSEVFHIVNEQTRAQCESPVRKVLELGTVVGLANHTLLIARDGRQRAIADSGAPIRDPLSRVLGVVLVFRDVTDQQRMERDLQRIEKLESVGVLAGGIAHDFNNLLATIVGNLSLARLHLPGSDPCSELLAQAEQAAMRARDLTLQLLTFARGGTPIKTATRLDTILRQAAAFALSGSRSRCAFVIPHDLPVVEVDAGQIGRVVHNLVTNADQAMPSGGTVTVRCELCQVGNESGLPLLPGEYVRVSVADQGLGIAKEHLTRIFDPYFTTKPKGSGLGLAVAHAIVKNHDGHIAVTSTLGIGTEFSVYLLARRARLQAEGPECPAAQSRRRRVLVMDDEPGVRAFVLRMLRHLGHEPEVATNGAEAIELYRRAMEQSRPFDVVILDLTVPGGMGGVDTINELRKLRAEVRAIASSGYSSDPVVSDFKSYGFSAALSKPYTTAQLAAAIERANGEGTG